MPSTVPAWRTGSGHILVQPLIDGQAPGYFILDTGAPLPLGALGFLAAGVPGGSAALLGEWRCAALPGGGGSGCWRLRVFL